MRNICLYPLGSTKACGWAAKALAGAGIFLVDHPAPEITHLLLDVPSFSPDGSLRGGGDLKQVLRMLPPDITVIGGKLRHPALEGYQTMDLLEDEEYVAENAAITAHCALKAAASRLETTYADTPVLVIGWGRIGKCLARLLRGLDAPVSIAARKPSDRALARALGYRALDMGQMAQELGEFSLICNTVPASVLTRQQLALCPWCVKMELASQPGLEGEDVILARGLPGTYAPASSGALIARTILAQIGRK